MINQAAELETVPWADDCGDTDEFKLVILKDDEGTYTVHIHMEGVLSQVIERVPHWQCVTAPAKLEKRFEI